MYPATLSFIIEWEIEMYKHEADRQQNILEHIQINKKPLSIA
jgi:hypothetical protein